MKKTETILKEKLKEKYFKIISDLLAANGEEVLQTGKAEICFPTVDEEQNERFIKIKVSIPIGANYGKEPYDGYEEHDAFLFKQEQDKIKAEKEAKEKAKKIERDKAYRAKKAEQEVKRKERERA